MAAVDYFLKLKTIDGESPDAKHKGEIQIESFSWGVTQSGTHASGAGGGAGKAVFQDMHCAAKIGKQSAKLMLACATGEHIAEGLLTCRKAGKEQQEFMKIKLTDLLVSSYQTGGSDIVPTEQFSLNFAKFEMEYAPQKADGSLDAAVKAGYDQKANKKV
jgi:type VI secretion system secreted protein Hcp